MSFPCTTNVTSRWDEKWNSNLTFDAPPGLSLYKDKKEAKAFFREWMTKTRGKFSKNKGDHLAKVELDQEDGVGNEPNIENFTHFTFHEYIDTDLAKKISQIEKI